MLVFYHEGQTLFNAHSAFRIMRESCQCAGPVLQGQAPTVSQRPGGELKTPRDRPVAVDPAALSCSPSELLVSRFLKVVTQMLYRL